MWDGEIAGIRRGLETVDRGRKVLVLSESQAAIAAVKRAGRTGKARTRDLRKVIQEIRRRQEMLGLGAVRFGWVKAHVDIFGNEKADEQAKMGSNDLYPITPYITEALPPHSKRTPNVRSQTIRGNPKKSPTSTPTALQIEVPTPKISYSTPTSPVPTTQAVVIHAAPTHYKAGTMRRWIEEGNR